MKLLRQLEMRIEAMLDGAAARVFRGPLHPMEMVARIIREADLGSHPGEFGLLAPNHFDILANPDECPDPADSAPLVHELRRLVEESAFERGWRLDGPVEVSLRSEISVPHGAIRCVPAFRPGPRPPWALLVGRETLPVTVNHAVLGRGNDCDVAVRSDATSRRHAVIWREAERTQIRDLGSSNGTVVDGIPIGATAVEVAVGSHIVLGEAGFRFERTRHA
jgi:hypothetical protein